MSRWTVTEIYYFSNDGRRRTVELSATGMNIITGPSGTGKSAIIETVDYCLCSSECNIPRYVRDRCGCVGVLWTNGPTKLLVCRLVPGPTGATSHRMHVLFGGAIEVPEDYRSLGGQSNLESARRQIQTLFGIGDVYQPNESELDAPERIGIRHATPYIFLSKNVIDSNSILLHGMEEPRFYPAIVNSLPYFLGIVDEQTLRYERELRNVTVELTKEERRLADAERTRASERESITALLTEAVQAGVVANFNPDASIDDLLPVLVRATHWQRGQGVTSPTDIRQQIQVEQEGLFERLRELRERRTVARRMNEIARSFNSTVNLEKQRLEVFALFDNITRSEQCPVCEQRMAEPSAMATTIREELQRLTEEESAIQRHTPKLDSAVYELDQAIAGIQRRNSELETRLTALIAEDDRATRARDSDARANRVVGRITYFLDHRAQVDLGSGRDRLDRLQERILVLRDHLDTQAREKLTRRLESEISGTASAIMHSLPLEEPCVNADLEFQLKHVEVSITDKASSVPTKLKSVGSDQNYLAIHIALYLALHRTFSLRNRPVPGVVFVDQVSRPYFPPQKHPDLVALSDAAVDPETAAVRQHFEFLFKEVDRWPDLQLVVLEHALFEDDPRYMSAVRHQWSKSPENKLIPNDWPVRS